MSWTFIWRNNDAEKLLTNSLKNNYSINNHGNYPFFISNEFIDFSE